VLALQEAVKQCLTCGRGFSTTSRSLSMPNSLGIVLIIAVAKSHFAVIHEVEALEGATPRGRPKKTWREIVEKDCRARGLNREDAMDHSRWRKQIRDD